MTMTLMEFMTKWEGIIRNLTKDDFTRKDGCSAAKSAYRSMGHVENSEKIYYFKTCTVFVLIVYVSTYLVPEHTTLLDLRGTPTRYEYSYTSEVHLHLGVTLLSRYEVQLHH